MRSLLCLMVLVLCLAPLAADAAAPSPNCLDCHADKKAEAVVHPAVEMGCEACHVGTHAGDKPAPKLSAPLPDLCFTCHDKAQIVKAVQHAPVAGGMCGSCHNPHATALPKLLTIGIPDLCFTCHNRASLAKKNVHMSAAQGKCLTCHAPHGSERAFVLTQLVEEHCASCHEEQLSGTHVMVRVSPGDGHPLQGKPDPLRKGRTLTCSSCHNPHAESAGKAAQLKTRPPAEICLQCHRRIKAGK